ncbi:hypothetical protein P1J78_12195 [Psychromarinibacter sp. C21-152]|uniref:Uncharacterized protein n=1 Tax=Psychromarinibacter sediminicola TaxID=3033385 RepID=A0AAE3NSZ3_9RHOB|nr:hypothetical protein [Psychromarinibacter sediminicola]MDF0601496.1 hypothetical protein [Psychromarinibacter sediminicola]
MNLFVSANVNLIQSGGAVRPTSTSSVSFDIARDRTYEKTDDLVAVLRKLADAVEAKKGEISSAFSELDEGKGDLRDKLRELGISPDALGQKGDNAAKLIGYALALVAMPNDPLR